MLLAGIGQKQGFDIPLLPLFISENLIDKFYSERFPARYSGIFHDSI